MTIAHPSLQPGRRGSPRAIGSVLIAFVIALIILQLLVFGIVAVAARNHDLTARRAEAVRSFYAAESALNMGIREVAIDTDIDGDGGVGSIASVSMGGPSAGVTAVTAGETVTLTATGDAGLARRRVAAVLQPSTANTGAGLFVEIWLTGSGLSALSQVPWATTPSYTGVVPNIDFPNQATSTRRFAGMPSSRIGMRFTGQIRIPTTGTWTFSLNSDDGSDLWIDGVRVINNDGLHSATTRTGSVTLTEGLHDLEVRFFENTGSNSLVLSWLGPGVPLTTVVPASAFSSDGSMPPLAAHTTMYLDGDNSANATTVDGYSSSNGAYGGSNINTAASVAALNSTAASSWRMSGRAIFQGSALIGPGSSPSSVIALSGSSSITGTRAAATSRTAIFLMPPTLSIASSGDLTLSGSSTQTVSSNRRWGNVTLSTNSVLTLSGAITVRIDGNLTISNNARVELGANADINMYVTGDVIVSNDGVLNPSTADAGRLRIYMSGTGRSLRITNRGRVCAHVLNPLGGLVISPDGNSPDSFSGRFAGDTVTTTDKTDIHLDLAPSGAGSGGSGAPSISSWSAVQP